MDQECKLCTQQICFTAYNSAKASKCLKPEKRFNKPWFICMLECHSSTEKSFQRVFYDVKNGPDIMQSGNNRTGVYYGSNCALKQAW